jgi:diguanylate cyclase (GGDEF)-like protein
MGLKTQYARLDRRTKVVVLRPAGSIIQAEGSKDGMNTRFDSTRRDGTISQGPTGGQASLRRRLAPDQDTRSRAITGAVLWSVQAAAGALLQWGPAGGAMPEPAFRVYLATTLSMALLCLFVGPRMRGRSFRIAEGFAVAGGWIATAALVAATGGAYSADIALFANVMFYCAYFMPPLRAAVNVAFGTILMWAPLAYDFDALAGSGFVARALVMTAVLWAMVLLIARNRHRAQTAELRARHLALTDPLTGVANLHTFNSELQSAVAEAAAAGGRLGVAFVDVNGLKAANTVHGHAGGDSLIRRTADALLRCSGERDQVARVGGDEFAVLLADADESRVREFEAAFALALLEQGPQEPTGSLALSASIGTARFPEDGRTLDQLMHVADQRMYDSKTALPQRLPTPGTSGGRVLSDVPRSEPTRVEALFAGAAPAAPYAWLLAAALIPVASVFGGAADVHERLAFAIAGLCIAIAGLLGIAKGSRRRQAERVANVLAVVLAVPAVYATGGATTPILPLAYLVVAHAAYALTPRAAALRSGAIFGILLATLAADFNRASSAGVSVILGELLVIAAVLRFNRMRTDAAERAALELSRTDALTGLANRRVFERTLAIAAEAPAAADAIGYDRGGLILIDVDDFKQINTSGGHKAGDEVLRMIAAVLEGAVGRDATVCRIGGDEFAVVMPAGDASAVMRMAEKCRAASGAVDWRVLCEPTVTLSLGYATWEQVDDWKDIVIAADLALRSSKRSGKDAVSTAPQSAARQIQMGLGPGADALAG